MALARSRTSKLAPAVQPEFPQSVKKIISLPDKETILNAMSDEAKFNVLFKKTAILTAILNRDCADEEFCKQLMRYITAHPCIFDNLFKLASSITYIAENISKKYAEIAIKYVLRNEASFSRIVRCKPDLTDLAKSFPNHASIFKQPNARIAKSANQIRNNFYLLSLMRLRISGPFQQIPRPILWKMAAYAGTDNNIREVQKIFLK